MAALVSVGVPGLGEAHWAEHDTSPERVEAALRRLLRERHVAGDALAPARVLNLVVIVDHQWKGEIANRLDRVGRYHASRTILCAVQEGRTEIDATAVLSGEERGEEGIGVLREVVELDIGADQLAHIDTIVDPVLVSELPTVLWSPHGHAAAVQALLGMVDVVLLDSDDLSPEAAGDPSPLAAPAAALERAEGITTHAYVVDLAWLRTIPWRERLAAAFDDPARRGELGRLESLCVRHNRASPASALLLTGWLASRLSWVPHPFELQSGRLRAVATRGEERDGAGGLGAASAGRSGAGTAEEVGMELVGVDLGVPGIAGVTVSSGAWLSLSLDRAPGGLISRERRGGGPEERWQVLGASRGEGGILGEGVRQALLRDPTYAPALAAARSLCR